MLRGHVTETRYAPVCTDAGAALVQTGVVTLGPGDIAHISDADGLHKCGAAAGAGGAGAVSLHVYAPPVSRCRVWLDPARPGASLRVAVTFHSEHGVLVPRGVTGGAGGAGAVDAASAGAADASADGDAA